MFETELKDEGIAAWLAKVAAVSAAPRGLMRAFAGTLGAETEKNFAAQGRPRWLGLKPRTLKRRGAGAKILQDSGQLAASISTAYGNDFARVGSNKPYAAIHQFGGQAGRGRKVKIAPRPFLPADRNGRLQEVARPALEADIQDFLRSLAPR